MTKSELMQSGRTNPYFKLDPRTKLLSLFLINATIFQGGDVFILAVMAGIPISLLFASRKPKSALLCAAAYAASALADSYLVPATHGILNVFVVMVSGMLYRLMPSLIMGYYLVVTTTVSEFIASMERIYISQKIIIPLSVMFRFFPTVGEEAHAIGDAMRMRGISFGDHRFWKNPLSMVEYRIVPLMMSTVKIGDELSAASLTRGLGSPVKRTNICQIGFNIPDIVLLGITLAAFVVFLLY